MSGGMSVAIIVSQHEKRNAAELLPISSELAAERLTFLMPTTLLYSIIHCCQVRYNTASYLRGAALGGYSSFSRHVAPVGTRHSRNNTET